MHRHCFELGLMNSSNTMGNIFINCRPDSDLKETAKLLTKLLTKLLKKLLIKLLTRTNGSDFNHSQKRCEIKEIEVISRYYFLNLKHNVYKFVAGYKFS